MRSGGVTVGMEEDRREQADAREKYDQASGAARRLREAEHSLALPFFGIG